jgi:hypothetical protein
MEIETEHTKIMALQENIPFLAKFVMQKITK